MSIGHENDISYFQGIPNSSLTHPKKLSKLLKQKTLSQFLNCDLTTVSAMAVVHGWEKERELTVLRTELDLGWGKGSQSRMPPS